MIYTQMTKTALEICFKAHKDQVDKGGTPYVFHPFHIAEQMDSEETVAVALLHDVIEDSDYTIPILLAMGFPESVTDALVLLTHDKAVPYLEYIAEIKQNPIARVVKLADLRHNCDTSRLDFLSIGEKELTRIEKYKKAIAILEDCD